MHISYTIFFLKHNGKEKYVGPVQEPIRLFDLLLLLLNILSLPHFKITFAFFFFTVVPCVLTLSKFFIHQLMHKRIDLKKNIKIYIKTAPTCFSAITIIRERIFKLAKVTVVNFCNFSKLKYALPDDGDCTETCRSCFNKNFNILFKAILLCISW